MEHSLLDYCKVERSRTVTIPDLEEPTEEEVLQGIRQPIRVREEDMPKAKQLSTIPNETQYRSVSGGKVKPCHLSAQDAQERIDILDSLKWSVEITVTFTDKVLNTYKDEFIIKDFSKFIHKKGQAFEYICIPDWSDSNRLHIHGIVHELDTVKASNALKCLKKKYGRCEYKMISYPDSYKKYMIGQFIQGHSKYREALKWKSEYFITNI